MAEPTEPAARAADLTALAARIRELEANVVRAPFDPSRAGHTNGCTNCGTNACTNCRGDKLVDVLLPGEEQPLSGVELVARLRTTRGQ